MFLNNCNQQPLYNGSMENVQPYYANTYMSAPSNDQQRLRVDMEQNMNRQEMNLNDMTDDSFNNSRRLMRNQ